MNRLEFFKWLDTHYTDAEHIRMVKEKFDNNSERFLDIEQSTAMDTELVNSIKESLVDGKRLIETGTEFGSFILNFINDIDDIETCEVDEEYYTIAKYRLKDTHINYHLNQ